MHIFRAQKANELRNGGAPALIQPLNLIVPPARSFLHRISGRRHERVCLAVVPARTRCRSRASPPSPGGCGLSPEPGGTAVLLDGDWSGCTGGDGRPVAGASRPLAALAAYRGESGELVIWASASSSACLTPRLRLGSRTHSRSLQSRLTRRCYRANVFRVRAVRRMRRRWARGNWVG